MTPLVCTLFPQDDIGCVCPPFRRLHRETILKAFPGIGEAMMSGIIQVCVILESRGQKNGVFWKRSLFPRILEILESPLDLENKRES